MGRNVRFAVVLVCVAAIAAAALPLAPCAAATEEEQSAPAKPGETIRTPTRAAQADPPPKVDDAEKAAGIIKSLPHIVVDRGKGTVAVDGLVCLREGVLELFACGAGIREHEAIVSLRARPRDINFALMLLGRAPGSPATWTKDGKFLPPHGPVFRVFIEYAEGGKPRRVEAHEWLTDMLTEKTANPQKWVFCGGATDEGRFIPDFEGWVVCLANFAAPILDVPYESSTKNTELLFEPRTEVIPEVGTPVKLILEATDQAVAGRQLLWQVTVEKDGSMTLEGKASSLEDLDKKLEKRHKYLEKVQVFAHPEAPAGRMLDAMDMITRHGLEVELYKKALFGAGSQKGEGAAKPAPGGQP